MKKNPVILVTGASGGIGEAVARCLGWAKATVVLMARQNLALERVASAVEELGGQAHVAAGDVADPEDCRRNIQEAIHRFGGLDALVNNAGVIEPLSPIAEAPVREWQESLRVNLFGPFFLARYGLTELRKSRGAIINISSGAAVTPIWGASAYCAAKAALNHFTRVIALEEPEVATVAVRPGMVDTPMQDRLRARAKRIMPREHSAVYQNARNNGLLEPPRRPARTVAWLALNPPHQRSGQFLDWNDPAIVNDAFSFFENCPV